MVNYVHKWIPKDTVSKLDNMFPYEKTTVQKFKRLNDMIDDMFYGVKKKNKKGSLFDLIYIFTVILAMSIVVLGMAKLSEDVSTQALLNDDIAADSAASDTFTQLSNLYPTMFDGTFLFITVLLVVISFVFASLVKVHPVFMVGYLLMLGFVIFLSAIYSNVYLAMANTDGFTTLAESMVFQTNIMGILPWITGIFGLILAVIMYSNYKNEG